MKQIRIIQKLEATLTMHFFSFFQDLLLSPTAELLRQGAAHDQQDHQAQHPRLVTSIPHHKTTLPVKLFGQMDTAFSLKEKQPLTSMKTFSSDIPSSQTGLRTMRRKRRIGR